MIEINKKVVFTDSAKMRLEKLHLDINSQIENYIRDRKNVPGDDFIEVTASDIDELSYLLRIVRPFKTNSRQLILYIYAITGVVTTLIGLFYDQILLLLESENKTRLLLILGGLIFSSAAFFLMYIFKIKERRERELIYYEKEKMREKDFYSTFNSK